MKNRNLDHSDNWATPKEFYEELNAEFNFDFDPPHLHKLGKESWMGKKYGILNPTWKQDIKIEIDE